MDAMTALIFEANSQLNTSARAADLADLDGSLLHQVLRRTVGARPMGLSHAISATPWRHCS